MLNVHAETISDSKKKHEFTLFARKQPLYPLPRPRTEELFLYDLLSTPRRHIRQITGLYKERLRSLTVVILVELNWDRIDFGLTKVTSFVYHGRTR